MLIGDKYKIESNLFFVRSHPEADIKALAEQLYEDYFASSEVGPDGILAEVAIDKVFSSLHLNTNLKVGRAIAKAQNVATEARLHVDIEQVKRETAKELFEEIICPMCYRLNPQHATADGGIGCKSCREKELWCGNP